MVLPKVRGKSRKEQGCRYLFQVFVNLFSVCFMQGRGLGEASDTFLGAQTARRCQKFSSKDKQKLMQHFKSESVQETHNQQNINILKAGCDPVLPGLSHPASPPF